MVNEKPPTGCIGVGTWNTAAEFKDIKVTAPDGKVLFQSDFSAGSDGWKMFGGGAGRRRVARCGKQPRRNSSGRLPETNRGPITHWNSKRAKSPAGKGSLFYSIST